MGDSRPERCEPMSGSRSRTLPIHRALRPPGLHRIAARPDKWSTRPAVRWTTRLSSNDCGGWRSHPHGWTCGRPPTPMRQCRRRASTGAVGRSTDTLPRPEHLASDYKFARMTLFAAAIPALRLQVASDIAQYRKDPLGARVVTAAIVRLLERGLLRVGNDRYARDNHTYGLTTLRRNHVETRGSTITFQFIGKEHLPHTVTVHDQVTAKVVGALVSAADNDAQPIFAVTGEHGTHHVTSAAVNAYLHAHTQAPASAKVFRTWGATVAAVAVLAGAEPPADVSGRSRERLAVGAAATLLGDTASVTRSSYIHPAWIDAGRSDLVVAAVAEASSRVGTCAIARLFTDPAVQAAVLSGITDMPSEVAAQDYDPGP